MGEIATSGGYIVALASNYILARQNTLTGSIGVIVENQNFLNYLKRLELELILQNQEKLKGQNPYLL